MVRKRKSNKQPHGLFKIYYISAILTIKYIVFPIYLIGSVDGKKSQGLGIGPIKVIGKREKSAGFDCLFIHQNFFPWNLSVRNFAWNY